MLVQKKNCDVCGSANVEHIKYDRIYRERVINRAEPHIWYCHDCGASVGCRLNSFDPLGKMALSDIGILRRKLHAAFDSCWTQASITRSLAYLVLQYTFGSEKELHIAELDKDQLLHAINVFTEFTANLDSFRKLARKIEQKNEKSRVKEKRRRMKIKRTIQNRKGEWK